MQVTTVSDFRENIKQFMDATWENDEEIFIARPKGKNVVVISEQEYNAWKETMYLLSSDANRKSLEKSMQEAKDGKLIYKTLEDLKGME